MLMPLMLDGIAVMLRRDTPHAATERSAAMRREEENMAPAADVTRKR